MTDPVRLLELAGDVFKSRRGDQDARRRLMRNALPLAADYLIRPGAGRLLERGLETLRDVASEEGWRLPGGLVDDTAGQLLPNYEPFVDRLVSSPYGFYTVMGEPGTGKTTLALRLAQRIVEEQGYRVVSVGGMHPDDRRKWSADEWIELEAPGAFVQAMGTVAETMVSARAHRHLKEITHRVVLLDDAIMTAHISAKRFNQALMQAWSIYRHLDWVILVTARQFRALTTVAENADARFLKKPDWQQLTSERDKARMWWREAEAAYRELRHSADWQQRPRERDWIYVQAPGLRYTGMLPYSAPSPPTVPTATVIVEPERESL
jgi:adenylate kinase family enzyme